jgi:hypothetical protein
VVPSKAVVVGVTEGDEVVETSYVKTLNEREDDDFVSIKFRDDFRADG